MSTFLYDESHFLKIRASLLNPWFESQKTNIFACELKRIFGFDAFNYDLDQFELAVTAFVVKLAQANSDAFHSRYPDQPTIPFQMPNLSRHVEAYRNSCELLKALRGVQYNIDTELNDFKETENRLSRIIDALTNRIIDDLPEYRNANTW